jgi:hypothetical protein
MLTVDFWLMTTYSPVGNSQRFGATYRLHLQNKVSKSGGVKRLYTQGTYSGLRHFAIGRPQTV